MSLLMRDGFSLCSVSGLQTGSCNKPCLCTCADLCLPSWFNSLALHSASFQMSPVIHFGMTNSVFLAILSSCWDNCWEQKRLQPVMHKGRSPAWGPDPTSDFDSFMLLPDKLQNYSNDTGLTVELLIPGQTIFWSVGAYLLFYLPFTRGFSRFFYLPEHLDACPWFGMWWEAQFF